MLMTPKMIWVICYNNAIELGYNYDKSRLIADIERETYEIKEKEKCLSIN